MTKADLNRELVLQEQEYDGDPTEVRETDQYRAEYVQSFVEKWDELIDWDARAESEGHFFVDVLRARGAHTVLDVAAGTGFHSVRLIEAGFDVTTCDGSAAMLARAFENGKDRQLILKTVQSDWRWLSKDVNGKFDAIICLGNSFNHLFDENDRRRALAEFYACLKHDGVLIIDQRNYDAILDKGFSTKHKYYYCGDQVVAEPEYIDDGLARFRYSFPDGSEYNLNMFPLRKNYLRKLLQEAGFQTIRTYGDFQETYQEYDPDFFVHVAEKSFVDDNEVIEDPMLQDSAQAAADTAEAYYDDSAADEFYFNIWGGEDIHVGLYETTKDIKEASHLTVKRMCEQAGRIDADTKVLDIGAGYGGSARVIAREYGAPVVALNISETQNERDRELNKAQGLDKLVTVKHGSYEDIPEADESFDLVWSQDAILHSGNKPKVFEEVFRVLKPGGCFIFTDPMQADVVSDPASLQPVLDRLHLDNMGSFALYRRLAREAGFTEGEHLELTHNLRTHYSRVSEEVKADYDNLVKLSAEDYLQRMLKGLDAWVTAADAGNLAWGILVFRKPERI
ncbi:glycine/sarcosine N-methyltransferase [Amorphus orientalis]|uniref:Sarcosine/dimethylglycine N-methyltransferase n=1 Tax=Amorphus orientalis TaxID=649198 RepID=A0AAE3VQ34_9HYPH|nr:class I SAM-dependent methyltransferase [Amorphus orientalis]MDQ0316217.1 sarcosine/dimethylglycine N-methyltransferase [Amorphus orientalis]